MKRELVEVVSKAAMALLLVQLISCNSTAPPTQEGRGKPDGNPFDVAAPGYFSAYLRVSRNTLTHPHIRQVTDVADVLLWDPDSASSIIAGNVSLNGIPLEMSISPDGSSYHSSYN